LTDGNLIAIPTNGLKPIEVPGELTWMVEQAGRLDRKVRGKTHLSPTGASGGSWGKMGRPFPRLCGQPFNLIHHPGELDGVADMNSNGRSRRGQN
jgi:hypothetical protein